MNEPFIIDAHLHTGLPGVFFVPESGPDHLLKMMDRLSIRSAVCCDHLSIYEGAQAGLGSLRRLHEDSGGRIHYLGVFNPRNPRECSRALEEAASWPGFVGLKLHPSAHRTPADSPSYQPAWQFAAEHDLAILAHSWSVSDYNPLQQYSTPEKFEAFVGEFPMVRFVLGHAGGRGSGRHQAVRMANEYPNVYVDFAGDIFCYRLIETLAESIPLEKILFGSDFPWISPAAHLTRVLLAEIDDRAKRHILVDNAAGVYRIEAK